MARLITTMSNWPCATSLLPLARPNLNFENILYTFDQCTQMSDIALVALTNFDIHGTIRGPRSMHSSPTNRKTNKDNEVRWR